jgi:hypothetical protein
MLSWWARAVVAKRLILAGIPIVLTALVALGVHLPTDWTAENVQEKVIAVFSVLALLLAGISAIRNVTPANTDLGPYRARVNRWSPQ